MLIDLCCCEEMMLDGVMIRNGDGDDMMNLETTCNSFLICCGL